MKKIMVVYDTGFGNTRMAADRIAKKLGVKAKSVSEAKIDDLKELELLIVGSPTYGGQAKPEMKAWLNSIPNGSLKGVAATAFDTRIKAEDSGLFLRLLMKLIGFAAPKMSETLKNKGAIIAAKPAGYYVEGKEGPLYEGELRKAEKWVEKFI